MLHLFNFEPCGSVGGSDKKIGLRIRELERLYGIKQGGSGFYGNQYSSDDLESNNFTPKTEEYRWVRPFGRNQTNIST